MTNITPENKHVVSIEMILIMKHIYKVQKLFLVSTKRSLLMTSVDLKWTLINIASE